MPRKTTPQIQKKKRLTALADQFAYEGATRIQTTEVIPNGAGLRAVFQAIYTTPDGIDFVDYWYRLQLGFGSQSPTAGVMFGSEGRRWSFYRDGLKFRKTPLLKRRGMRLRQYVFDGDGNQLIVLISRQPEEPVTQIVITILPEMDA